MLPLFEKWNPTHVFKNPRVYVLQTKDSDAFERQVEEMRKLNLTLKVKGGGGERESISFNLCYFGFS